jgi:hypothetical protein
MPSDLTLRGIAALKANDQQQAQDLLVQSLTLDQTDEQAWLWLSGAVSSDAERRYCLERVLMLNPQHSAAQQGLTRLPAHIAAQSPLQAASIANPVTPIGISTPSVLAAPPAPTEPPQEPSLVTTSAPQLATPSATQRMTQTTTSSFAPSLEGLRPAPQKSRPRWLLFAGGALLAVALLLVGSFVVFPRLTRPDLTKIDLAPLLMQPGDLPTGMTGGQIGKMLPGLDGKLPRPTNMIYQELAKEGEFVGVSAILLYDSPTDLEQAYAFLATDFDGIPAVPAQVGDKATSFSGTHSVTILDSPMLFSISGLTFARCQAVVQIRITNSFNLTAVTAYAQRLDQRLQPIVCR